jgi:hypothetical protein
MAECRDIRRFIALNRGIDANGVGKAIQNIVYAMRGELSRRLAGVIARSARPLPMQRSGSFPGFRALTQV